MRRSGRILRVCAVLVAAALASAACGNGSAPIESSRTTTTDVADEPPATTGAPAPMSAENPVELTASFRGVTETSIRVGIITFDYDFFTLAGYGFGNTNIDGVYEAALEQINDRGGVRGRTLDFTNIVYNPIVATESDEYCVRLTADVEVFVVVGELDNNVTCYTKLNGTAVIAAYGVYGEFLEQELDQAPHVAVRMAHERLAAGLVDELVDAGLLEDHKVAVVGAPGVTETNFIPVVDALDEVGIEPFEALIRVGDPRAAVEDGRLLTEVLRAEGVTFLINTLAAPLSLGIGAENELPTALFPIISGAAMRAGEIDLAPVDGAYAVTQSDVYTVVQPDMVNDPAVAQCVEGIESRTDASIAYEIDALVNNLDWALTACATAEILERALLNAGPDLTNETFRAGLAAIGDIDLPGFGASSLAPGKIDAADRLTLVQFDAELGAWLEVG